MSNEEIGVIFDMDGVIIDNHHYHTKAWNTFWDEHNLEISEEIYAKFINGRTNNDIMRYLFGHDITQERIDQLSYEKEKMYRNIYEEDIVIAKGLDTLLEQLKDNSVSMAVASAGPTENVSFALDKLGIRHYFSSVIDSGMVKKGKPDPEAYNKSVKRFGLNPSQCLVFEDSFFGIQAGKASGCTTVAICTTFDRDKLKSSEADYIIDSFEEVDMPFVQNLILKANE